MNDNLFKSYLFIKKIFKTIDILIKCCIIVGSGAELCKGSTADSDSVCMGSNPISAVFINVTEKDFFSVTFCIVMFLLSELIVQ